MQTPHLDKSSCKCSKEKGKSVGKDEPYATNRKTMTVNH